MVRCGRPVRRLAAPLWLGLLSALVRAAASEDDKAVDVWQDFGATLELNPDNFEEALERNPYLFVSFYAPWCGHSQAMRESFLEAAQLMEGHVAFGWLDATLHKDIAKKYRIRGYPTIKLLHEGSDVEYIGNRKVEHFELWLNNRTIPPVSVLTKAETKGLEAKLQGRNSSKVIFHASGDEAFLQLLTDVSMRARQRSAWAMRRFSFAKTKKGRNKLEVYRGVAEQVSFEGNFSSLDEVEAFVEAEELPLFGECDDDNFEAYLSIASRGMLWLCLAPEKVAEETRRLYQGLGTEARLYRGELPFLWIDAVEYVEHVRDDLRCTSFPMVVVQLGDMRDDEQEGAILKYKKALPVDFTPEVVGKFLEDCIAGRVQPVDPIDEEDEKFEHLGDGHDDQEL